jgi:hypothetical protein
MKKYIVVDTWNGDGYSYENGVDTKQFQYKKAAFKYAYQRVLSNAGDVSDDVCRYSDEKPTEHWKPVKRGTDGDGFYFETYDDNCGSYQVWETKDAYAIMIQCNVNDVTMLTKEEYKEHIEELDAMYGSDLEEYCETDDNGDKFYCSLVDDYDYQFRLIKNL